MTRARLGEPLTYPVAGLLEDVAGTLRVYPVSGVTIGIGDDLELAEPIDGQVRLTRTNRGLIVDADLHAALATKCSRCLRDVDVPITLKIREEALPSVELTTGTPLDTSREPDALWLTARHELLLEPVVRDEIYLAEPIAPLCRPDCPGLCVTCGLELEGGPHAHAEEIDERLSVLRGFTVDGEAESG
jgi:uncharacterized protein